MSFSLDRWKSCGNYGQLHVQKKSIAHINCWLIDKRGIFRRHAAFLMRNIFASLDGVHKPKLE